jgi:hypothetical protein
MHDIKSSRNKNLKYFKKILILYRHSYQMNIFINDLNVISLFYSYYLIMININTRYVVLEKMIDQTEKSVLDAHKIKFIKDK